MRVFVDAFVLQVWAVTGGSDGIADRFDELVPDMALDFPFELDAFQKEVTVILLLNFYTTNLLMVSR